MKRPTKLAHKKLVNNITHCYLDADPVQIQDGMAWYAAAYDAAYDIGNKYGIGVYLVVAVISALSPNNKWSRNVSNADALIGAGICFMFLGLMQGLGATVSGAFWPEFFGTKHLGSVRAVAMSLMVFATGLGPLGSGILIDKGFGLEQQYILMAGITLLACCAMFFVSLGTRKLFH